jgi:head-tail adaptor
MANPIGSMARELRQRVQFQRLTTTTDAAGLPIQTWADYGQSVACNLTPYRAQKRGGAEQVIAARLQGTAVFDLWVRWSNFTDGITAEDRCYEPSKPGVFYNIRFAQDMNSRKVWILMQAELGVAA